MPLQPGEKRALHLLEDVGLGAPGPLEDAERVVGGLDAVQLGPAPEAIHEPDEQVLAGEGIASALDEELGSAEAGPGGVAELLGAPRGVQWVGQEGQAVGPVAGGHDLGSDPSPHGAPPHHHPLGARPVQGDPGSLPCRALQHLRGVGPAGTPFGVGKVVQERGPPGGGEGLGEIHQHGRVPGASGPVPQDHDGTAGPVKGGAGVGGGQPQLTHAVGRITDPPAGPPAAGDTLAPRAPPCTSPGTASPRSPST